eukprot:Pgem_evm1s15368
MAFLIGAGASIGAIVALQNRFPGPRFTECRHLEDFDQQLSINDRVFQPFSYVIASDPQLWRHLNVSGEKVKAEAERDNVAQVNAINMYVDRQGNKPRSVVVNGDLTEYGHVNELDTFRTHWDNRIENSRVYYGLGNHDIENNYNDCYFTTFGGHYIPRGNKGCMNAMLDFHDDHLRCSTAKSNGWTAAGSTLRSYNRAAQAYAWVDKGVYFIQLNHFIIKENKRVAIEKEAKFTNAAKANYLKHQIEKAKAADIKVIVNVHHNNELVWDVVKNYNDTVLAIFSGHLHPKYGLQTDETDHANGVPSFRSGASDYHTFLSLEFSSTTAPGKVTLYNSTTSSPVEINSQDIGSLGVDTPTSETSPCPADSGSQAEFWTWERCRSGRVTIHGTDGGDVLLPENGELKSNLFFSKWQNEISWSCGGSLERTVIDNDFNYNAVSIKVRHQRNNGGLISFGINRCYNSLSNIVVSPVREPSNGQCEMGISEQWKWERCRSAEVKIHGSDHGDVRLPQNGRLVNNIYFTRGKINRIEWSCGNDRQHVDISDNGYAAIKLRIRHNRKDGGLISFGI